MTRYSILWNYFVERYNDKLNKSFVKCAFCKRNIKFNGNTTYLHNHLRCIHSGKYRAIMKKNNENPELKITKKRVSTPSRTSAVWNYFTDIADDSCGKSLVQCQICNKVLEKNRQLLNMYKHLLVHEIPICRRDVEQTKKRKSIKILTSEKSPRTSAERQPFQPSSNSTAVLELKTEPNVIFDDDLDTNHISLELVTPEASREPSPQLSQPTCDNMNLNVVINQKVFDNPTHPTHPGSSTSFTDSSQLSDVHFNGADHFSVATNITGALSDMRADIENLKSKMNENDSAFFKSISEEMDSMTEDARDIVKAAVWQIIMKVKSAKRKNKEATLSHLVK